MKPLVYLDICCFNRPFDDKSILRNRLEAEAKIFVQRQILIGRLSVAWSFILELENNENPYEEVKTQISAWRKVASVNIPWNPEVIQNAETFQFKLGIEAKDALHIASAIQSKSDYFLTTDRKFLSKIRQLETIKCINPVEWIDGEAP